MNSNSNSLPLVLCGIDMAKGSCGVGQDRFNCTCSAGRIGVGGSEEIKTGGGRGFLNSSTKQGTELVDIFRLNLARMWLERSVPLR